MSRVLRRERKGASYTHLLAVELIICPSLLIIAGDISPIDIVSHLPVLAEDAEIPYIFIPSKEELGHYSATKRPTSCIMICPTQKRKKVEKDEDEAEFLELYQECLAEVKKLDTQIVF